MADDTHRFVEMLNKSGLLKAAEISLDDFAELMVSQGVVTRWQCDKLRDGKFKGFFLDDFLLLDFDHVDEQRSYYVARNMITGKLAILGVYPRGPYTPGDDKTHYDVLPFNQN